MDQTERTRIYSKAWELWGDLQFIMMVEEPAELIKAVTKYLRNRTRENGIHIAEEVADVEIMCEQFKLLSPEMNQLVEKYKEEKLERLKRNVEAASEPSPKARRVGISSES